MCQNANYFNHFGSVKVYCKPETLVTDTLIICMIQLGMLVSIMHDKNLISPLNNVAFRIPSAKLTVDFYDKSLENANLSNRNPPTRLHYYCLAEEI